MAKMILPDNSPKNKRRMVAATGASEPTQITNQMVKSGLTHSSLANIPVTKAAQFAGTGVNAVMTQPMFFSPLHTPQNWQIASKRREIYQWSFLPSTLITISPDLSLSYIFDIVSNINKSIYKSNIMCVKNTSSEDNLYIQNTYDGSSDTDVKYIQNETFVQDGYGNESHVDKVSERYVEKKINEITTLGVAEPIKVTNDHNCIVIKNKDVVCHRTHGNSKKCVAGHNATTCKMFKCDEYKDKEYNISTVKARDVEKGDYFLVPFNTDVIDSIITTKEEARFAGHLAADGSVSQKGRGVRVCMTIEEIDYVANSVLPVFSKFGVNNKIESCKSDKLVEVRSSQKDLSDYAHSLVKGKREEKKFTEQVVLLDPSLQLDVIGAYIQSDGTFNKKNNCVEITSYSKNLANQLLIMCYRCNILARVNKQPISKGGYKTDNTHRYIINISSSECEKIKDYVPGKMKDVVLRKKGANKRFFWKNYVVSPVVSNKSFDYKGYVYDIRVPSSFTVTADGISIHQCRFYYSNEPKVAAGVDFYSNFSMNGFTLQCKNKKVLKYYERLCKKLDLAEKLNSISHEYFLLGDVFPFLEIDCKICGGRGIKKDGQVCNHPEGSFKNIKIMNPDFVEVRSNPLATSPEFYLIPDDELRTLIQRKEPKNAYNQLPPDLIRLISSGQPIPLSSRSISHIKHNASDYVNYGSSMLQRLFTYLAYKTKIMTANWIVAERLILPVRIVKVGEKDRPATEDDIQDIVTQLSAVANDPNLTIVTHHAIDYDWIGAAGKIHNITQEMENVGKEILDGLMLNQAILNGEAASYSSAQVGVETLIRRLDNWREKLKNWVEDRIFLPIAMMMGFEDEKESELIGETAYEVPDLIWNDLQLRDKTNRIQTLMQMQEKGLVSTQTLLEEVELDYDTEVQKMREEQVLASASGMLGGGAANQGSMGMGGGMGGMPGGGMPGGEMGGMPGEEMGGMPGGEMGGMPGGEMGGMPGGGAPGGMGAAGGNLPMITKRGKGSEQEEQVAPPPQMIKLTKLEQQMYKALQELNVPYPLFGQFNVKVPGEQRPFVLDFAYPQIGVGIESDGAIWHQREDLEQRDAERDQKLANVGWRILRFKEDAIEGHMDAVQDIIKTNVIEAHKDLHKKKAEGGVEMMKYASIDEYIRDTSPGKIGISITNLNGYGELWCIGEKIE